MIDPSNIVKSLQLEGLTPDEQMQVLQGIQRTIAQSKKIQRQENIKSNVNVVIDLLKKIEADIRSRYDEVGNKLEARVASIRDGVDGKDGKDGAPGRDGRDGPMGPRGQNGRDGKDGVDGQDGVSVTGAKIDFDGSLIITLSTGREINVGEVVAADLAEKIRVTMSTNSAVAIQDEGTTLTSGVKNINFTGTGVTATASGDSVTVNVTGTSGGLSYQGTWNASTNTPTLTSSVGTNGYYYIVSVAGSTNLNGITDWQPSDWAIFNGSTWQKIDQSNLVTSVNGQTGAVTLTASSVGALASVASADGSVTVSTVGTAVDLSVATATSTTNVLCQVRNATGATLTKGTVVYITGATGQLPTVSKAQANSDATSAQTLGLMTADLANNSNGYVTVIGLITNIDTSAYSDGAQLYLSATTAGTMTATKPYAPDHIVYVAVVEHAHPTQGKLFVKVQNGYELDELHNVSAQSPSNGQTLIYNATTSLWTKGNLTAGTGINITNGAGSITVANSAPDQTVALTGAGTTSITGTYPNFTITSNDQYTGTVTGVTGTAPVSSSGGTAPAISLASGYGDTQNPYASKTANYVLAAPNGVAGVPTFRAIVAADIPTLNQNTTGTASNVTGTVAIANGGTGATTAATARTNLGSTTVGDNLFTLTNPSAVTFPRFNADNTVSALSASAFRTAIGAGTGDGTVTSVTGTAPISSSGGTTPAISLASGYGDTQNPYASKTANYFLAAPNGTTGAPTFRAIVAADVPTLNQNTTGTASNVTGVVALANGGSGQTTAQTAMNAFAGAVTSGSYLRGNGTNVVMSAIQAADVPTLNQNTTGTASNVTGTVAIANGGTGQTTKVAAFDALSPLTTKGDLIAYDGTDNVRLPVGTNNFVLTADSTAATGLKWAAAGSGSALTVQDEGTTLTSSATSINFTGAGVTATAVGSAVTVTIPGGGSTSVPPKARLDMWMIGAM